MIARLDCGHEPCSPARSRPKQSGPALAGPIRAGDFSSSIPKAKVMTAIEINKGARTYLTSPSGVKITVHKSVRNNWKTTEHRDGETNVVKPHESRQAAITYARSIE